MARSRILVAARCVRDRRRTRLAEARRDAPQVGIVRTFVRSPAVMVVVKATLSYAGARGEGEPVVPELAAEQAPISLSRPSRLPGAGPDDLAVASDLVPAKGGTEVLLVGHAYRHGGPWSSREDVTWIEAGLRLERWSRSFVVAASGSARRLPLTRAYLRAHGGDGSGEVEPVGPVRGPMPEVPPAHHPRGFDVRSYNAAPLEQRLVDAPHDVAIELQNLSPEAERVALRLPALAPRVLVERRIERPVELGMRRDTIAIDTDAQQITLVWRAGMVVGDLDDPGIDRVVVSLEDIDAPRPFAEIRRQLPRGAFYYAAEAEDLVEGAAPVPEDDEILRAARYASWGHREAPDPLLDLAEYTGASAEVAAGKIGKAALLERVGLDEYGWNLEQRAWAARIAAAQSRGDRELLAEHRRLLTEARRGAAAPRSLAAAARATSGEG